jgi:hypothetical protein
MYYGACAEREECTRTIAGAYRIHGSLQAEAADTGCATCRRWRDGRGIDNLLRVLGYGMTQPDHGSD